MNTSDTTLYEELDIFAHGHKNGMLIISLVFVTRDIQVIKYEVCYSNN